MKISSVLSLTALAAVTLPLVAAVPAFAAPSEAAVAPAMAALAEDAADGGDGGFEAAAEHVAGAELDAAQRAELAENHREAAAMHFDNMSSRGWNRDVNIGAS
ncbi:hypothetical protein OG333_37050 (plasmid) [Streptomyces anulatus]|uniref:hypothetical protein n=1 Tax=Streptomyces anulatus TaxID=1892 RepID=UPI002F90CFC3|nr:hypothetical protein OG333_37050 [Streptomyces anulatus]